MYDKVSFSEVMYDKVSFLEVIYNKVSFLEVIYNKVSFSEVMYDKVSFSEVMYDKVSFSEVVYDKVSFLEVVYDKVSFLEVMYYNLVQLAHHLFGPPTAACQLEFGFDDGSKLIRGHSTTKLPLFYQSSGTAWYITSGRAARPSKACVLLVQCTSNQLLCGQHGGVEIWESSYTPRLLTCFVIGLEHLLCQTSLMISAKPELLHLHGLKLHDTLAP
jgi:hypothetical protein